MDIRLDREETTPLYRQIVAQVLAQIEDGRLPRGTLLPPERTLAAHLQVNRSTIVAAYQDLVATGLVAARVGRGTWISEDENPAPAPLSWSALFSPTLERLQLLGQRDLLGALQLPGRRTTPSGQQPRSISLGTGTPDPALFPIARFRQALDLALDLARGDEVGTLFGYGPVQGLPALRDALVTWMARRGILATAERVVVVHGSQQGLDLLARLFIEPGDAVVVETPTYVGALQVFRGAGARLLPVPLDDEGLRVDLLEQLLARHRPKFIYTLPTCQNPTGITMSRRRRHAVLDLATRHGIPIVEDDAYGELSYGETAPPPLAALDQHGIVIYLATMSKILLPGIRIGWLNAPPPVAEALSQIRQTMDLHPNGPMQQALSIFLARGWLDEHLARLRPAIRTRRDAMLAALAASAPPGMTWNTPTGGNFVWARLPNELRATSLAVEAAREGVAFLAGEAFSPTGGERDALRLNFAGVPEEEIAEGVRRLTVAIRRLTPTERRPVARHSAELRPIV
jgi:2-aminoadipate transaminase